MKASKIFLWAFFITVCSTVAQAQTLKLGPENNTANIIASPQVITLDYNDFATIAVSSNYPYNNIHSDADWLTWKLQKNGNIAIFAQPNYNLNSRSAYLNIEIDPTYKDKVSNIASSMVFVLQKGKDSSDKQLTIKSGTASQAESGYAINRSFDGDNSTFYHSPWSSATTRFPVTLTYTLNEPSHVDYAIYTPRQDGNNNGNFQEVVVSYQVEGSNEWITLRSMNLSGSGSSSYISFGDNGVDNVKAVQFTVNSGANGFACVAEMAFYQKDTFFNDIVSEIFADNLCTQLKDGVTKEQIDQIAVDGIRNLATAIYEGTYSTKYRVGEFEAYRPVNDLINELRNSYTYNNHENPTGISFKNGENVMVIAEGIGDYPVTLQVRNFGPTDFTTDYYPLTNGINVISCKHKGNGYINYYTSDYKNAPNVKIHFVNCDENGYFDIERGDTNNDWVKLLANAKGDCMDFKGKYIQGVFPVETLKQNCPSNGKWLVETYDSIVALEHQIMGLDKYNRKPKNHMTVITVATSGGLYHASNDGFCVPVNALRDPTSPTYFDFWGAAHELGHVNQTNGILWIGLTEVTNNIYSAYVEHMLRPNKYHRLENESNGFRYYDFMEYNIMKGGQFVPHANNDVFCTLIPFWQLLVYTRIAGIQPDAYPDMFEKMRTMTLAGMDDGQKQVNFMRQWCHITKTNYLPYFEKVGMFKTVDASIGDYSTRQLTITQAMLNNLKTEIEAANYPLPPAALYYLDVNNMPAFRDKAALVSNTLNAGCVRSGNNVKITHSYWKNVVGFETYDANGKLLHCTSYGHGSPDYVPTYTNVVWNTSENPAYIMVVGYDGTKIKCYQP